MNNTAERLYELLPAIYRIRDAEQGETLRDLVAVIAEQIEALEENLAQSYDDHFIETCSDWVIPYIGDLIGYCTPHGVAPEIASQRAEVANTIGFRRRKGTASMLEQEPEESPVWPREPFISSGIVLKVNFFSHHGKGEESCLTRSTLLRHPLSRSPPDSPCSALRPPLGVGDSLDQTDPFVMISPSYCLLVRSA